MIVAIGDSIRDIASSNNENDEQTEQGKLSKDDKPCWVMGTISTMVQQRWEKCLVNQMKLDELTIQVWEDAADYMGE
jgi:hypothetical protein